LLTAVQAIEFRRPLTTSPQLEAVIKEFRKDISFNEADRVMHNDMKLAIEFLQNKIPPVI
jgi:histidine ammonia-lyase